LQLAAEEAAAAWAKADEAAAAATLKPQTTRPRPRVIVVEGLLLLAEDEGAQLVREEVCVGVATARGFESARF
jgi:pantothenate kinase